MVSEYYSFLVYFAVNVVVEYFPKFQDLNNYHVPQAFPRLFY